LDDLSHPLETNNTNKNTTRQSRGFFYGV
jgi:hypothetical protein